MNIWHKEIKELAGALLVVEGVEGARYEEIVGIQLANGKTLEGMVLEAHKDKAVVQVLGSTIGIGPKNAKVRLTGKVSMLDVGEDMRARIFSGSGKIIDGGPAPLTEESRAINGEPMNPYARELPDEFIQTGISSIDALNTLVRGQKLPIFSLSGLPHPALAAQIARQATVLTDKADFMVVFGAIGVTHEESRYFIEDFQRTGALENSVLFINHADDPVVERIMLPRLALTTAEYFAFQKNTHVLVILTDITNYCEALREMSASRKEIPGRRGYPGYMYTDLANLYERAGVVKGSTGSVTQLPILTMPDDDKTHPIPDLTGYITEGQITLSRELHTQGYFPPVDVLSSLSRLKNKGIGDKKTREDHSSVSDQIFASYAKSKQVKELAQILGESALTAEDKMFLKFNTEFEKRFVNQGSEENRTIEETLDLCWELLALIPRSELKRVKPEMIKKYLKES